MNIHGASFDAYESSVPDSLCSSHYLAHEDDHGNSCDRNGAQAGLRPRDREPDDSESQRDDAKFCNAWKRKYQ
jgi:hypothetical protein